MPLLRHHLARFSAKLFAINSSSIPPQHKPPSGAKSGLIVRVPAGSQKIVSPNKIQAEYVWTIPGGIESVMIRHLGSVEFHV